MRAGEIRSTIRSFLHLVEQGTLSIEQNEKSLSLMVDRLALASHYNLSLGGRVDLPEPPERDLDELHELTVHRFPSFGYYNFPDKVVRDVARTSCLVGDAIEDIVEVAIDLYDVEWYWENVSGVSALSYFDDRYLDHWGEHLRQLQVYLYFVLKRKSVRV